MSPRRLAAAGIAAALLALGAGCGDDEEETALPGGAKATEVSAPGVGEVDEAGDIPGLKETKTQGDDADRSPSDDLGTPDPGTPDPGTPDPGTPDPGTPDPGTPDPGTPDPGTPDPDPDPPDPDPTPVHEGGDEN